MRVLRVLRVMRVMSIGVAWRSKLGRQSSKLGRQNVCQFKFLPKLAWKFYSMTKKLGRQQPHLPQWRYAYGYEGYEGFEGYEDYKVLRVLRVFGVLRIWEEWGFWGYDDFTRIDIQTSFIRNLFLTLW